MKLKNPASQIHQNMILTGEGDVMAYYRVDAESISNHDFEQKEQRKRKLNNVLKQLAQYGEFSLSLIPKEMNLRERYFGDGNPDHASLSDDFAEDVKDVADYYANRQIELLEREFGTITTSYFVIGVQLKNGYVDSSLRESAAKVLDTGVRSIASAFRLGVIVDDSFFEKFSDINDEVAAVVRAIGGSKMTEKEMMYFERYPFIRGIKHSVSEESEYQSVLAASDAILDAKRPGAVHIRTDHGESYSALIPISELPEDVANLHFFELAQITKTPIEFHLKAKHKPKKGLLGGGLSGKLSSTERMVSSEDKDRVQSQQGDTGGRIRRVRQLIPRMQASMDAGNEFFDWMGIFVIHGSTYEEVRDNRNDFIRLMANRKVTLARASGFQMDLFYRMLPGYSIRDEKRWMQVSSQGGLAENLFATAHVLGNNVGWYIGRVINIMESQDVQKSLYASSDLVFLNPMVSNQGISKSKTSSPHMAITGQTGKGKSFLVKLIMVYLSMMNAKILYIDPKQEIRRWFGRATQDQEFQRKYPYLMKLLNQYHFTTLDPANSDNWGILDPIVFMAGVEKQGEHAEPDADPAFDIAYALIEQVFTINSQYVRSNIEQAIKDTIIQKWEGERVGMLDVIDKLKNNERQEIVDAAEALETTVSTGLLKLSFSHGEQDSVSFETRVNILEVAGLDLPNEGDNPAMYSSIQRKSLATMLALGKFADRFGRENPDEYTFEVIDEAWIFTVSSVGRSLLKSIKRVGRSFNNALVYATQSIGDVSSEDDHGQFGVLFAFDEPSERDDILKFVHLQDNEGNKEWLGNFVKGEALLSDLYGRKDKLGIHSIFPEISELFKTLEKSRSASAEERFG